MTSITSKLNNIYVDKSSNDLINQLYFVFGQSHQIISQIEDDLVYIKVSKDDTHTARISYNPYSSIFSAIAYTPDILEKSPTRLPMLDSTESLDIVKFVLDQIGIPENEQNFITISKQT